jgi:hypothetical protein
VKNALGSAWLEDGWIDISLRRPLYADECVSISVDQRDSNWVVNAAVRIDGTTRVVLDGEAGLGSAPWYCDVNPPTIAPGRQTNDHWYQVLDGIVSQQQEIARIRHHTIFRPRGT